MAIDRVSSTGITTPFQSANVRENHQKYAGENSQEKQTENQNERQWDVSKNFLEKTVRGVNEFLLPSTTSLKFQLHDELGEYFVQVIDDETKEVVREIPPKEFLDLYAAMKDILGLVVDEKV